MPEGLFILVRFVGLFIDIILIAFFVRAILSWFTMGGESVLSNILYGFTEPFIMPVRLLCEKFGWFEGIPIDMPFMISSLLLALINMLITSMV